ncbi:MAG: hypothetical protein PHX20_02680 [Candidatus Omnitrophica bacterium]|nr:hypothetical protein [Candidatus Omnitrophota bacterium]MDD5436428.1 hypothetical protein [Candidatus Omnitrophota bacterium]
MKRLEKEFAVSRTAMKKIMEAFCSEMEKGLAGKGGSLKMIPTYVEMPTGKERGRYIALDLGGTNFRVLELALKGDHKVGRPNIMKFALEKKHMSGSAELFFGFIADCVKDFLKRYKLPDDRPLDLGFTFSFPIRQTGIASGILMCWTKGFAARGVVGSDVVKLMNKALARKGIKNINISALVNDTVGTLVAKCYEKPDCDVGVIIGTGSNACYPEKLSGIKKWHGPGNRSGQMVINIEWGNFNKLAVTSYDRQLDRNSNNPGEQILEKMVSGMYLGQIAGLVLKDMGIEPDSFETMHMSEIEDDATKDLRKTRALLAKLGLPKTSIKERRLIRKVCGIISARAARISASCIAAILTRIDPDISGTHTIAIDGSVFEKHPTFANAMKEALKDIFARKAGRIKLALAKDGSGKGAAIVAAVAAKR